MYVFWKRLLVEMVFQNSTLTFDFDYGNCRDVLAGRDLVQTLVLHVMHGSPIRSY